MCGTKRSEIYHGVRPRGALKIINLILKSILKHGSQFKEAKTGVMQSHLLPLVKSPAAEFCTVWSRSIENGLCVFKS